MTGNLERIGGYNPYLGRDGFVYFAQVNTNGPVKIGFTTSNPAIRIRAAQQACPYKLNWLGYFAGSMADEQALHKRFDRYRLRGEWFRPVAPILEFIKSKCPGFDERNARADLLHFNLAAEIKATVSHHSHHDRELFLACCEQFGVDYTDYRRWRERSSAPSQQTLDGCRKALVLFKEKKTKLKAAA
jgi:Meiotically up-regulated gene 113